MDTQANYCLPATLQKQHYTAALPPCPGVQRTAKNLGVGPLSLPATRLRKAIGSGLPECDQLRVSRPYDTAAAGVLSSAHVAPFPQATSS